MKRSLHPLANPTQPTAAPLAGGPTASSLPAAGPHSQLAETAARLTRGGGLADLYYSQDLREARRQIRKTELEHETRVKIKEVRSIAETQMQQITLLSTQRREALVTAENAGLGQLKREQQELAAMELMSIIAGQRCRKQRVDSADLLPEDRQLLQLMNQIRSHARIREVSGEHGVHFTDPPRPAAEADHETFPYES